MLIEDEKQANEDSGCSLKFKRIGLLIIYTLISFIAVVLFEIKVISPLVLPEDYCYYHFHETPYLIELFYMNGGSNGHPEGNLLLLTTEFIIALLLGFCLNYIFFKLKKKKDL